MGTKWNVYLEKKWIDSVFFNDDLDKDYVYNALVNHDGYDSRIKVVKARRKK